MNFHSTLVIRAREKLFVCHVLESEIDLSSFPDFDLPMILNCIIVIFNPEDRTWHRADTKSACNNTFDSYRTEPQKQ